MKTLKDFSRVLDYQTFVIILLSLLSTYLCRMYGLIADMPITVVGIAVVFPLVFSINSAYRRREDALKAFAGLKGHAIALFFAHQDWTPDAKDEAGRASKLVQDLLDAMAVYFKSDENSKEARFEAVYAIFARFSQSHEALRKAGVTNSEISRANQYLRSMMIEFEQMDNVFRYRTPIALRAYSRLFLNSFPILFGPYFANVAYPEAPFVGYVIAILYAVVLVSLDNIQDHLENPYDGEGVDDLNLRVLDKYSVFNL